MKNSKWFMGIHLILLVLSGGLVSVLEYDELWYLRDMVSKLLPFLDGHRVFYNSLMLGIFSSILLVLLGTAITYRTEYTRLSDEILINYKLSFIHIKKILGNDNLTYDEYKDVVSELGKHFTLGMALKKQFSPIKTWNKKNKRYAEINDIIYKTYLLSNCKENFELINMKKELLQIKENYDKDLKSTTNENKIIKYYTKKIDELNKKIEETQNKIITDYRNKLSQFDSKLKEINDFFGFNI